MEPGQQRRITPVHVRGLHCEKLHAGLASATVRKIHSTLHKALSQAVADGLIPRNAANVRAPRPAAEEMRPLSEVEARVFLEVARTSGDRFESLYVLAITTGLRRGELLELRWDDVDLECGTLRVGRSLVREGGRHTVGETKTRRGRRQVNLTLRTVSDHKCELAWQHHPSVRGAALMSTGTFERRPKRSIFLSW